MSIIDEFRTFAVKGNMVDMATGIIIGAAFGAIVSSLVDDIIMPPIGMLVGGVDFSQLFVVLDGPNGYATIEQAKEAGAVTWNIGLFINAVIKFLIVAWAVFLLVRAMNRVFYRQKAEPETAPEPPRDVVLLEEIRDLLARATPPPPPGGAGRADEAERA